MAADCRLPSKQVHYYSISGVATKKAGHQEIRGMSIPCFLMSGHLVTKGLSAR